MIPYGDPRKSHPAIDNCQHQEERRRAASAAEAFGSRNARGPMIDFGASGPAAAPSSGMGGSIMDAYAPSFRAEMLKRDERAAKVDRLPVKVQRLAQEQGITDLDLLTVVGAVVAKNSVMGAEAKVQIFGSDLGRAMGVTSDQADALLNEAARRGFIERFGDNYVRARI
jgi:hypothetical protein